jgi:hypothetical protein
MKLDSDLILKATLRWVRASAHTLHSEVTVTSSKGVDYVQFTLYSQGPIRLKLIGRVGWLMGPETSDLS